MCVCVCVCVCVFKCACVCVTMFVYGRMHIVHMSSFGVLRMYALISYLLSQEINPEKYFLSDPEALKFSLQSPSHMPFILSHLNLTIQGKGILYKCGGKL